MIWSVIDYRITIDIHRGYYMHTVSCKIDENDKKQVQAPSYEQIIRSRLKEAENQENYSPEFKDVDNLMMSLDD